MGSRPFALIGVNGDRHDSAALKEVTEREKLNWRSIADPSGELVEEWNRPLTPAYYLIDHLGIIRKRWIGHPGDKVIDETVEEQVRLAEAAGRR